MKQFFIFSFLIVSFSGLRAQKELQVTITPDLPLSTNFYISEIIDARPLKENIGVAQRGMFNKQVSAQFSEDFIPHLQSYFNGLLPSEASKTPLILKVHQLYISERTAAMSELGSCDVNLEFLKEENGRQYSLGQFSSKVENGGLDVTAGHDKRIKQAIQECVEQFALSNWDDSEVENVLVQNEQHFQPLENLKKGLYHHFGELKSNSPKTDIPYYSKMISQSKKAQHYQVFESNKKKRIKNLFGYSDGTHVYLNASRYTQGEYFIQSKMIGRYIYFEDQYASSAATAAGGLVGTLVSMRHLGIILDTQTGITTVLNNRNMELLLDDYPFLKEAYAQTDKSIEADRSMIEKINEHESLRTL